MNVSLFFECNLQHVIHRAQSHSYRTLIYFFFGFIVIFLSPKFLQNLKFRSHMMVSNIAQTLLVLYNLLELVISRFHLPLCSFIRLKMLWTKKCPISTLKMGFIGLKNRNLFYFFKRTHTLTHARARTHAFTLVRTPNRRPNRMTC